MTIQRKDIFMVSHQTGENGFLASRETFDTSGRSLSVVNFDERGAVVGKEENEYNEKGEVVRLSTYTYDANNPDQIFIFKYNEDGKVSTESRHYADGSESELIFEYDRAARTENITMFDGFENVELTEFRRFDEKDRMVFEEIKDENGEVTQRIELTYNADDQIETQSIFDANFKTTRIIHFAYELDDEKRVTAYSAYNDKDVLLLTVYVDYDEHGRRIQREESDQVNGGDTIETWEYDEEGRVLLHTTTQPDNEFVVEQAFDEKGELVRREERNRFGANLYLYEYQYHTS
jgi:hypothetical protein